jgi:hypothetical protein
MVVLRVFGLTAPLSASPSTRRPASTRFPATCGATFGDEDADVAVGDLDVGGIDDPFPDSLSGCVGFGVQERPDEFGAATRTTFDGTRPPSAALDTTERRGPLEWLLQSSGSSGSLLGSVTTSVLTIYKDRLAARNEIKIRDQQYERDRQAARMPSGGESNPRLADSGLEIPQGCPRRA